MSMIINDTVLHDNTILANVIDFGESSDKLTLERERQRERERERTIQFKNICSKLKI